MEEADRKSPGTAFFLSIVPGAGHLYAGRTGAGLGWLVVTVLAYGRSPGVGLALHFVCAWMAAGAAAASNAAEAAHFERRRESAAEVAKMLDQAVAHGGPPDPPPPPPPPVAADPPPRVMQGAFPVPPAALLRAIPAAMREGGLLVLGEDERHGRVRGSLDHGGGRNTMVVAQVEPTPAGSRIRLLIDRPPGSAAGPESDDTALRGLLDAIDRGLRASASYGSSPAAATAPAPVLGGGEALTEDHFLQQLREAWESYEQGWLPEAEWTQRKDSLLRSVVLRGGTRKSDFMTACRPLVEAGVLDVADLRTLESTIPG